MKNYLPFIFLLIFSITHAENKENVTNQVIRGTVVDDVSKTPLVGVTLSIIDSDPLIGTITDVDGNFAFEPLPPGRYSITVSYLGYESTVLSNILLGTGKEVVLNIALQESVTSLDEVKIVANKKRGEALNKMSMISSRSFTVEETRKYAGGWNDPARMAAGYAGVVGGTSGSNEIMIRGNSPRGLLWRVEGVPIANPNHFANEGATGGPISVINSAMLDNSDFFTAAFPSEYGNATSGVFDINLRQGNNQKKEHTVQTGILGIDLATEGPVSKGKDGSYLVNFPYSTLALLKNIGVKVADEAVPVYSDMAFNLTLPSCKAGQFQIFGLGGYSDIKMKEPEFKENYEADMGVFGIKQKC